MSLQELTDNQLTHAKLLAEELLSKGHNKETKVVVIFHNTRHSLYDDEIQELKVVQGDNIILKTHTLQEFYEHKS